MPGSRSGARAECNAVKNYGSKEQRAELTRGFLAKDLAGTRPFHQKPIGLGTCGLCVCVCGWGGGVFCFLCFGFCILYFDIFCILCFVFSVCCFVFCILFSILDFIYLWDDDKFLGAVLKVSGGGKLRYVNVNGETKLELQFLYVLVWCNRFFWKLTLFQCMRWNSGVNEC